MLYELRNLLVMVVVENIEVISAPFFPCLHPFKKLTIFLQLPDSIKDFWMKICTPNREIIKFSVSSNPKVTLI